jgi:hypothetical protein
VVVAVAEFEERVAFRFVETTPAFLAEVGSSLVSEAIGCSPVPDFLQARLKE